MPNITAQPDQHPVLTFNGVHGRTGAYLLGPVPMSLIAEVATGYQPTAQELAAVTEKCQHAAGSHYVSSDGPELDDLAHAGWAIVFAEPRDRAARMHRDAIARALAPLLNLRCEQATRCDGRRFRILHCRHDETWEDFLYRHQVEPSPRQHDKLPYYLLFAASPEQIPFHVQYEADVQHAVGRLDFARVDDYAAYAARVVAAETSPPRACRKRVGFFGVRNRGDLATELSADELVAPLAGFVREAVTSDWNIATHIGAEATKQRLCALLGGDDTPSVLFTASHGVGFDCGDRHQVARQGALLCQDWPGPGAPVTARHYVAGADIATAADLRGMISFHFACYGAGTPAHDDFTRVAGQARRLARRPFVAALPRRMLAHPRGALACVGHVDRAWDRSFRWRPAERNVAAAPELTSFQTTLKRILDGQRIGLAMDGFDLRYAQLAASLTNMLQRARTFALAPDPSSLAYKWLCCNDARNYTVLGDPAVRLALAASPAGA